MHDVVLRAEARRRHSAGESCAVICRELGLPWSTVRRWLVTSMSTDQTPPTRCFVEHGGVPTQLLADSYCYLLGQYLGDGHLVTRARVPVLRIYCCTDYPVILGRVRHAIQVVRDRSPGLVRTSSTTRMVKVQSYWRHWPCLLPQHGPGMKHTRPIVLTDWQRELVADHPWPLVAGLIHSDGCRSLNRVVVNAKVYSYPRYLFANESGDILAIMGEALDRVGVAWRYNRPNSISIARREAIALMDVHIGPKT